MPVVGAPLAGGPSTPALTAAVSDAGGLGFLAAGYLAAADVEAEIAAVRSATGRPFGVNLFYPARDEIDDVALAAYVDRLRGEASRHGVEPGEPRWSDDDWEAKLELVQRERPAVVSFTFGCPKRETVESLRAAEVAVWCTVTSVAEAQTAAAAGADALVVQGREAGGHQGSFLHEAWQPVPLLTLLADGARATGVPLIGAGGIGDASGVAAALAAGASAVQVGTALLLTPEAGTSAPHRRALAGEETTTLTRAFTGRTARGIVNRFIREHEQAAPRGYPEIHYVTAPIRAAARAAGDAEAINLWAGESYRLAHEKPTAEVVERLVAAGQSAA